MFDGSGFQPEGMLNLGLEAHATLMTTTGTMSNLYANDHPAGHL
jgi:hypothetical protein